MRSQGLGHYRRTHEKRLQGDFGSQALERRIRPVLRWSPLLIAIACLPLVLRYHLSAYVVAKSGAQPELWYWHHSYNVNYQNTDKSRALIDKAVAAGYTGVVFWDSGFNYLGNDAWPAENEDFLRDAVGYANKKHLRVVAAPTLYGYSNETLEANPNWAESQRAVGSQFQVDPLGKRL